MFPLIKGNNYSYIPLEPDNGMEIYLFMECPRPSCKVCFSTRYSFVIKAGNNYVFDYDWIQTFALKTVEFSDTINKISESFVEIYGQANQAEQYNLDKVCGVGYRKALEFLIKDYLISIKADKAEEIKKKFLGICINDYIDNTNIKLVAERAVWLGNDETHYIRKWVDHDVEDLKGLIELTVRWIEMEVMTKEIEKRMVKGIK
ncbi:hypothetical protein [Salmonirosea aquatica]|uniref:hypothetical protein n=1 Tax=Salmonirosea aquatica TaxID=2654236 RepID=UPI0035717641